MKLTIFLLLMLSRFVSTQEAYHSPTAERLKIDNVPTGEKAHLVQYVAIHHFDSIRLAANSPLYISSFYRSPALNKAVGGAKASDHQALGDVAALDVDQDGKPRALLNNAEVFNLVHTQHKYYKLIYEFGTGPYFKEDGSLDTEKSKPAWVHMAFSKDEQKNELRKTYVARKVNNKTIYTIYGRA